MLESAKKNVCLTLSFTLVVPFILVLPQQLGGDPHRIQTTHTAGKKAGFVDLSAAI